MENKGLFLPSTFVCIFNKDFSKILLIKRNQQKREKYGIHWANIGGKVEFGELSIDACIREANEEAGLKLNKSDLKLVLVKETPRPSITGIIYHFFYVINLPETIKITLNEESDEYAWFDINKLPEKMPNDNIPEIIRLAKAKQTL